MVRTLNLSKTFRIVSAFSVNKGRDLHLTKKQNLLEKERQKAKRCLNNFLLEQHDLPKLMKRSDFTVEDLRDVVYILPILQDHADEAYKSFVRYADLRTQMVSMTDKVDIHFVKHPLMDAEKYANDLEKILKGILNGENKICDSLQSHAQRREVREMITTIQDHVKTIHVIIGLIDKEYSKLKKLIYNCSDSVLQKRLETEMKDIVDDYDLGKFLSSTEEHVYETDAKNKKVIQQTLETPIGEIEIDSKNRKSYLNVCNTLAIDMLSTIQGLIDKDLSDSKKLATALHTLQASHLETNKLVVQLAIWQYCYTQEQLLSSKVTTRGKRTRQITELIDWDVLKQTYVSFHKQLEDRVACQIKEVDYMACYFGAFVRGAYEKLQQFGQSIYSAIEKVVGKLDFQAHAFQNKLKMLFESHSRRMRESWSSRKQKIFVTYCEYMDILTEFFTMQKLYPAF